MQHDTSSPKVYGLILNFNGKAFLLETLASVTQITYSNLHLLVVDNGSTDGSVQAARALFPNVTFIENGANLGFGEGNNAGMRYALQHGADWVLLLNNDLTVAPDLLTHMMQAAAADERLGMLGPKIYYHDQPGTIWFAGGRINYWAGTTSHRGIRELDRGQYDRAEETDYLTGCTLLIRREVLERVGMFDPIYFPAYSEDADLCVRAARGGYRLLYVPQAKVWHKVSSSSGGGMTPFKTKLKVQHSLIFFKRYARWYHWLTMPWCIAALAFVFVMKELLKGNWSVIAALLRGFARAPRKLQKNI